MVEIITPHQRLQQIIDYAYMLFCNQVAGGSIHVENEASMQLHLSNILLQLGRLNIFSPDEHFNIELEKKIKLNKPTIKSKNQNARVDIWIELRSGNQLYCATIELKYLKKSHTAQAVTDGRYSVYEDLENLEQYAAQHPLLIVSEIIYTNNKNFAISNQNLKFSIANNTVITSYPGDPKYPQISLSRRYSPIKWDILRRDYFLKIN